LNAFTIKIIAISAMAADHLAYCFPDIFPLECRVIGRLALPLFVYMAAEGCRHTGSALKYLLRLGIFAVLSQIPFCLAFHQPPSGQFYFSFVKTTNVFYTLFLGVLCACCLKTLRIIFCGADKSKKASPFMETVAGLEPVKKILAVLPKKVKAVLPYVLSLAVLAAAMRLAKFLETDYAAYGVAFVYAMYAIENKKWRLAVMAAFCVWQFKEGLFGGLYRFTGLSQLEAYLGYFNWWWFAFTLGCLAAVLAAALYNGRRGPRFKWAFYVFYPAHLLLFGLILMGGAASAAVIF